MADQTSTAANTNGSDHAAESSSTKEQMTEIALTLLAQGRRHILVTDIPNAISALAESTRLLAELYGEQADECAESYYYYGVALLELARTDSDVLGDAVESGKKEDGESEDDDDDEGEDEEEEDKEDEDKAKEGKPNGEHAEAGCSADKTGEEMKEDLAKSLAPKEDNLVDMEPKAGEPQEENGQKDESGAQNGQTNGHEAKADATKKESKGKALKPAGSSAESKTEEEGDAEDGPEGDAGDDVTNLQLAWEVFELAKNIYQRKAEENPIFKPRLADSLIRLAEVAIESENYNSAIEDLNKCRDIQIASFPADSRSLAETHYQLGVAYTFTTDFQEAIKSFTAAANVIKLRIENLKNPAEKKPSMEEPKNLFHTIEGEIEELESLLPDIEEKIADTVDLEKEAARKVAENGTTSGAPITNGAGGSEADNDTAMNVGNSPSKPASDITHLIRKKRKPEDVAEGEASAPKKVCADPVA